MKPLLQPKDVMSVLGQPEGVYVKERDHVAIYREATEHDRDLEPTPFEPSARDYFYNYFSAGIDILFDGKHHRAKKFVLHTNFPGHPEFNVYHKCQFHLEVPTERELKRPQEVKEVQEVRIYLLYFPPKSSSFLCFPSDSQPFVSLLDRLWEICWATPNLPR